MADMDDEGKWLRDSLAGDERAFGALVARYQCMIHAVTYRMTGSPEEAEDLAQETFIRAYRQLGTFRGEAKFSSWLCRVAVNACLNWRAREGWRDEVHRRWAGESLPSGSARPEGDAPARDDASARVQAALDRLPAKQRAAMILTVYEELSHADAARAMGCTEATISWRVFAARTKLKKWLRTQTK